MRPKSIGLFGSDRKKGQVLIDREIQDTVKFGGGNVMV